jgi:hypothetical protein
VQISFFGSAAGLFAARRTINIAAAWGKRFENGIEVLHDVVFAADHLAVAALKSPDAAAGADVHVVQPFRREFFCAANVVNIVGISTVDNDIADVELGGSIHGAWHRTTPAGTISQMARGLLSFFTKSSREEEPVAPSAAI